VSVLFQTAAKLADFTASHDHQIRAVFDGGAARGRGERGALQPDGG
jgi:hypothetical protein